ncbi:MAG: type II toxin-antitoxin system RelE/ParE family toxin [Sulfuricaulis sp.]
MKIRWTRPALNDLIEAQTYIAQNNPQAAQAVAQRLWDSARGLADHPQIGRPGHVADTREWIVRRTPYLIVYRGRAEILEILRLWHTKRDWQSEPDAG